MPYGEIHPLNIEPQPLVGTHGRLRSALLLMAAIVAAFAAVAAVRAVVVDDGTPKPAPSGATVPG